MVFIPQFCHYSQLLSHFIHTTIFCTTEVTPGNNQHSNTLIISVAGTRSVVRSNLPLQNFSLTYCVFILLTKQGSIILGQRSSEVFSFSSFLPSSFYVNTTPLDQPYATCYTLASMFGYQHICLP